MPHGTAAGTLKAGPSQRPPGEISKTSTRAVPRGVWHRVALREPSHMLYVTPGPGGQYRPLDGGPPRDVSGTTRRSARPSRNQVNLVVYL